MGCENSDFHHNDSQADGHKDPGYCEVRSAELPDGVRPPHATEVFEIPPSAIGYCSPRPNPSLVSAQTVFPVRLLDRDPHLDKWCQGIILATFSDDVILEYAYHYTGSQQEAILRLIRRLLEDLNSLRAADID